MLTNVTPGTSLAIKYTLTTLYINKLWNRFDPPNTLDLVSLTTWNGVNMFLKFLVKQLRHWIFFGAIWLLHLGIQSKLHTKHWFALSVSMQLLFGIPIMKLRQKMVEKVQKTAARWTCRRWRNRSCVDDMLDELEWPSLEDRRVKSSLTFFYKIHSGTVSLNKDRYLTSAPNLRSTRASHDSQYTRHALKNSFFPRTIPLWNSLPSSVVSSKTADEFRALI